MSRDTDAFDIFVVEDETLLVMDLEDMIEHAGHRFAGDAASLQEVMDGSSAVALKNADLFLVDMQLRNNSNGLQVADHLREIGDPLIVFITANPAAIPDDCGPGDAILPKPIYEASFMEALAYLQKGESLGCVPDKAPSDLRVSERLKKRWNAAS